MYSMKIALCRFCLLLYHTHTHTNKLTRKGGIVSLLLYHTHTYNKIIVVIFILEKGYYTLHKVEFSHLDFKK
jgi:hypothetical protein